MTKIDIDEIEEKPLEPELEKVRRKMIRLLGVSIGIMFVGLMAVLAAIVYKVSQPDEEVALADAPAVTGAASPAVGFATGPVEAALPEGFVVEDVSLDGGNVLFFGRLADFSARAFIVEAATGTVLGELVINPVEQP